MGINSIIKLEIVVWFITILLVLLVILYLVISYIIKLLKNHKNNDIDRHEQYIQDVTMQEQENSDDIDGDIIKKMLDAEPDNKPIVEESYAEIVANGELDDSIIVNMLQMDGMQTASTIQIQSNDEGSRINISNDKEADEDKLTIESDPKDIDMVVSTQEIINPSVQMESINKQQSLYQHLLSQIENFKARGIVDEFEKKLVHATMEFPHDEKLNYMLADFYFNKGDLKKSMSIYKKLHELNDQDDRSLYHLGLINLELGDIKSAEYLLSKAIQLKPENPKYLITMAEVKYNLDDIVSSIDAVEKAITLRPNKFDYLEILARLYKESKDEGNYHKILLKMIELDPLNINVKNELSKIYRG